MAKAPSKIAETELYLPVKAFLEAQDYEVKGEVGAADIVAVRAEEPLVIVELKTAFSLTLFHQAIERQSVSEWVYVAVPRGSGKPWMAALKRNMKLARRLGLGILSVRLKDGFVEAHLDPGPYQPRISKPKANRLLREFQKRLGDPNLGGHSKGKIITAYRQDALKCAEYLAEHGPSKASDIAKATEVERARNIMYVNHYGWFEAQGKGIYALSDVGAKEALAP